MSKKPVIEEPFEGILESETQRNTEEDYSTQTSKSDVVWFKPRNTKKYPIRRAEAIKVGQMYRTRGGLRARIYAIEREGIHGAILENNLWKPEVWGRNGFFLRSGKDHAKDIVVKSTIKFEEGKEYRARKGSKAVIFFINKNRPDFPMVGCIEEGDGSMTPRVWNLEGVVKKPHTPGSDLVAPWEES